MGGRCACQGRDRRLRPRSDFQRALATAAAAAHSFNGERMNRTREVCDDNSPPGRGAECAPPLSIIDSAARLSRALLLSSWFSCVYSSALQKHGHTIVKTHQINTASRDPPKQRQHTSPPRTLEQVALAHRPAECFPSVALKNKMAACKTLAIVLGESAGRVSTAVGAPMRISHPIIGLLCRDGARGLAIETRRSRSQPLSGADAR